PRVLDLMCRRFAQSPAEVLADFQQACGGAGPALPADCGPLAAGLDELSRLDARARWTARAGDIRLLAGRRDAIVPPALSDAAANALSNHHARWVDDGGHLLPITHPEACAALIREVASE
ncbi:MAG: alpha/beta fold hydrolase, partial [Ignavibacteria bacterium]